MANFLTIRGFVCSGVELRNTQAGFVVGNFRMGSTHRRQDPVSNAWVDGDTNWFRVNVFRTLANNASSSIHKGDRIIVVGRLHLVSYLRKDGNPAISVEIDAESIGPDLQFGTALYARTGAARAAGSAPNPNGVDSQGLNAGSGTPYGASSRYESHDESPDHVREDGPDPEDAPAGDVDAELADMAGEAQAGEVTVDGEPVNQETGEVGGKDTVPF